MSDKQQWTDTQTPEQRPQIKDFFGEDATLPIVMKIYEDQPELFKYAQALDNYIDEVEAQASLPSASPTGGYACEQYGHDIIPLLGEGNSTIGDMCRQCGVRIPKSTHSATAGESKEKEEVLKKHVTGDDKLVVPFEEYLQYDSTKDILATMEEYAQSHSASFSLEVVEDAFNEGVDDHLRGDSAYKTGKNYIKEMIK